MFLKNIHTKTLGTALLIAGTAIGAGMLSLPLSVGTGGLIGSSVIMLIGFFYMLSTFFLLLEILCYQKDTPTLSGVSRLYLGKWGEAVSAGGFLCLLYLASAAYINGATDLIQNYLPVDSITTLQVTLTLIVGLICSYGVKWIEMLNRLLMSLLIISFVTLVWQIAPHATIGDNLVGEPSFLIRTVPIVVLSFTSHIILPSIIPYLKHHIGNIKTAMVLGSLIPLSLYVIWIFLIVMLIPFKGPNSLLLISALQSGQLSALSNVIQNSFHITSLRLLNDFFAFFAITTSFLGVTISVSDSISESLNITKRPLSILLTLAPPLMIALFKPAGFISILNYGGIFIAVIYGLIPSRIAWLARYHHRQKSLYTLPGGKISLLFIPFVAILIVAIVILNDQGWLPHP
jgi:tyrosine-specific transport protein